MFRGRGRPPQARQGGRAADYSYATRRSVMVRHTKGPGRHGYLAGGRKPPEYAIWSGIIQRCRNPNCNVYPYYGGRGIDVCARWLEAQGFVNFLADVGPQPGPRASLNRIDNDGD